jgi:hypothetical protein
MTIDTRIPPSAETRAERTIPVKYIVGGVVGLLLVGALLALGITLLSRSFSLEISVVRDLFIIVLALEACIFGIVLIVLLVMVARLVNTVEFEIKPILQKTNDIVGTAKGTTDFVSENIVQPTIRAKGYVAGVRAGAETLFGDPQKQMPK